MIELIGLIWGFFTCFTFGSVFFVIIQKSIEKTFRTGIFIAIGVVLTDALMIITTLLGTSFIPEISRNTQKIINLSGIFILLVIGCYYFFKTIKEVRLERKKNEKPLILYYILLGMGLNGINVLNFLMWASTSAFLKTSLNFTIKQQLSFFLMALLGILIGEIVIAFYANKLRYFFTLKRMAIFNKITGAVFFLLALRILWKSLGEGLF